jgi:hypothetical protein
MFPTSKKEKIMRTTTNAIVGVAITLLLGGIVESPVYAQLPWSAVPGTCASTDNNFYSGTPSSNFPVARFRVPGGAVAFNGFHDGYIAFLCNVDNPRDSGTTARWSQLQVAYRDPDGLQTGHQAYVELVRVNKTTGAWQSIAKFDSNLQCAGTDCGADNNVKNIAVPFTHTFDFANYAYTVYARLYRAPLFFDVGSPAIVYSPAIYELRLQAAPSLVVAPVAGTIAP